jgi:hypothetical protein
MVEVIQAMATRRVTVALAPDGVKNCRQDAGATKSLLAQFARAQAEHFSTELLKSFWKSRAETA